MNDREALHREQFCYLTTAGRVSGRAHEIEIWFALDGSKLYMLAGNHRSDWVRNIDHTPRVTVRIAGRIMQGHGRRVEIGGQEEERARVLVGTKYGEWRPGRTRTGWTWEALPMAVDLEENTEHRT
jgi:F420H(2)-dependent quinone reductase